MKLRFLCSVLLLFATLARAVDPVPTHSLSLDTGGNPTSNLNLGGPNITGTVAISRLPIGTTPSTVMRGDDSRSSARFTPEMYGAVADGTSHPLSERFSSLAAAQATYSFATALSNEIDWAAAQKAVGIAELVGGEVFLGSKTYVFDQELRVTKSVTIAGCGSNICYGSVVAGSGGNIEAVNIPTVAPWLNGSVILQTGAGKNGLTIVSVGAAVHLRNFGVRFADAIKFTSTGRGVACVPPTVAGGFQDSGIMGSTWERITVYGHDGNHYGFDITNPLNCRLTDLSAFGGGGLRVNTNGQTGVNNYLGNVVLDAPYMVTMVPGTAHAYQVDAVNGETILLTYIRPQSWVKDVRASGLVSVLPLATQRTFNVVAPTTQAPLSAGSSWLNIIAPDLETTVPGVTYNIPTVQGIFLGPGLLNDYSNPAYNLSVQDVRIGTLRLYNGELTNLGVTTLRGQSAGAGVLNLLGAASQVGESLTVRDVNANVLASLSAMGAYLNHKGGWRVEDDAVFADGVASGLEGGYSKTGAFGFLQSFNRSNSTYQPLRLYASSISLRGAGGVGLDIDAAGTVTVAGVVDFPLLGAVPPAPASGKLRLYGLTSDGKAYILQSNGTPHPLW